MDNQFHAKLDALFAEYAVAAEDRTFWFSRFENATAGAREAIIALFREMPTEIRWLRTTQERKEAAFASGDREAWRQIIETEKARMASLSV
jgi:hypothetical protein